MGEASCSCSCSYQTGGNVTSNVLLEIISLDVVNKGVSVHITQPKALTILGNHVVIMKLIHDDLTQMEDDVPEKDGFVHKILVGTFPSHMQSGVTEFDF